MCIEILLKESQNKNREKINDFKVENKNMKIGIMGGTFDPIHYAHLVTAEFIREEYKLDKIIFIPSGNPPHKQRKITDKYDRYKMVNLAVADNYNFLVSNIEINRTEKTYTVDTLKYIKEEYSDIDVYFITGADAICDIETWKDVEENFKLATFIAATRPGISLEDVTKKIETLTKKYNANIKNVYVPSLDISSTYIRKQIEKNKSIRYLVPENVEKYIYKNNLYKNGEK